MLQVEEKCKQGFGEKSRKRPLGRPRCRWEDNIKMYLKRNRMWWFGQGSHGTRQGPVAGLVDTVKKLGVA
jgi:hypothetical protein